MKRLRDLKLGETFKYKNETYLKIAPINLTTIDLSKVVFGVNLTSYKVVVLQSSNIRIDKDNNIKEAI